MSPLTPRQTEILTLVCAGMTDKAIARRLGLQPATPKRHMRDAVARLGFHNRIQAAVWAAKKGLV